MDSRPGHNNSNVPLYYDWWSGLKLMFCEVNHYLDHMVLVDTGISVSSHDNLKVT